VDVGGDVGRLLGLQFWLLGWRYIFAKGFDAGFELGFGGWGYKGEAEEVG
jgi:hypothetical protein